MGQRPVLDGALRRGTAHDTEACKRMSGRHIDTATAVLQPLAGQAALWLADAFTLWHVRGVDRLRGGFHERLSLLGVPTEHPRRAFVQARQAYSYCEAGRLGWDGPWLAAALHAGRFLLERYVSPEGAVVHAVDPSGQVIDASVDLYDAGFVLFALAHLYDVAGRSPAHLEAAERILRYLRRERAHSEIGFVEFSGSALRQNPHMHLLEAALAWIEVSGEERWWALAEELVTLAERHFIDVKSGAVAEHFESDWSCLGGREAAVIEPGHQYEWAFLLARWDRLRGYPDRAACANLFMLAETQGRDPHRGVAVHDIDIRGRWTNGTARIWAQTERLRAAVTLLPRLEQAQRAAAIAAAVESSLALAEFLDTPIRGLWRDKWLVDGGFVEEPVPASSLYHLVTGYGALLECVGCSLPILNSSDAFDSQFEAP